jgi:hypothetical protein
MSQGGKGRDHNARDERLTDVAGKVIDEVVA